MFKQYPLSELLQMIKADLKDDHHMVFDCDGTLIDGDVSSLTGWQLMKSGLVDIELIPQQYRDPSFYTKMNLLDYDQVRKEVESIHGSFYSLEWELLIQSGIPHQLIVDYAHQAIDHGFNNSIVSYTGVLPELLKDFAAQSWIVSGSSFPTVVALAEKLGLTHERVLATKLELIDGVYQKNFSPPGFVWEETKVVALNSVGVDSPYLVAGDSPGDWHMMQKASHWVWCMVWNKRHFGSRNYRNFLSEKLPFGQDIPQEAGFYVTEWQRKHWVFEVR
jgi:phosphoserine phosphatase